MTKPRFDKKRWRPAVRRPDKNEARLFNRYAQRMWVMLRNEHKKYLRILAVRGDAWARIHRQGRS